MLTKTTILGQDTAVVLIADERYQPEYRENIYFTTIVDNEIKLSCIKDGVFMWSRYFNLVTGVENRKKRNTQQ